MTREYYNVTRRRAWPLVARLADQARRERRRAHHAKYVPNPLTQADTSRLVHEEAELILRLSHADSAWVKLWPLLNSMAPGDSENVRRSKRQALLVLVGRMLKEGKLLRHRKTNTISLAAWIKIPQPQVIE